MTHVEHTVLHGGLVTKPALYCRYVDDILVDVEGYEHLNLLKSQLESVSGLHFTTELSLDDKICFLDVSLDCSDGTFKTTVFRKPTDKGRCMNGSSNCPERYKESVVRAYVNIALTHCSSWTLLHLELKRIKQLLANNKYPITLVDKCIRDAIDKHVKTSQK